MASGRENAALARRSAAANREQERGAALRDASRALARLGAAQDYADASAEIERLTRELEAARERQRAARAAGLSVPGPRARALPSVERERAAAAAAVAAVVGALGSKRAAAEALGVPPALVAKLCRAAGAPGGG